MEVTDVLFAVARATVLFVCGMACLRAMGRSAPASRHVICLATIGTSLAALLTMLLPQPAVVLHIPAIAGAATPAGAGSKTWPWAAFAAAIWTSGCAFVILRYLVGCIFLARLRRSATKLSDTGGVPVVAALVLAADVSVPIVTGLFRPLILMPRGAVGWPEQQRSAAIRHEWAHLRRGDLWANFVSVAATAVYWFHPLVWILARRLRAEQEAAADDAVLQSGFNSTEYAQALIETARCAGSHLIPSCAMTDRAGVKARVIRALSPAAVRPVPRTVRRTWQRVCVGFLLLLAAVSSVGAERIYKTGGDVTNPSVVQKVEPAYTEEARQAKTQGTVLLKMVVGTDGLARDITVEKGIGMGLDQNAIQAVRQWQFKPAERDGKPVAVRAKVAINFRLL